MVPSGVQVPCGVRTLCRRSMPTSMATTKNTTCESKLTLALRSLLIPQRITLQCKC
jgi:hypothetical protein